MQNLLLLHGALGSAEMLRPLQEALQDTFAVHTLNFPGHGCSGQPPQPFTMQQLVQQVLSYIEEGRLGCVHIFGFSMGGYAALAAALQQPTAVASVFTWGTKFAWSPEGAAHETRLLNPAKVAEKVPHFAATLAQRHGPDRWQPLMQHTAAMMQQLGTHPLLTQDSLPQLQRPVQIAVGDSDTMVDIKETLWAYRLLPQAYLQVLPATQHPFETLSITELSAHIRQFIQRAGVSL